MLFSDVARAGLLQPPMVATIINSITVLQDTLSNLERIRNTPLPFAYQAHLRMSLWYALLETFTFHVTQKCLSFAQVVSLVPSRTFDVPGPILVSTLYSSSKSTLHLVGLPFPGRLSRHSCFSDSWRSDRKCMPLYLPGMDLETD